MPSDYDESRRQPCDILHRYGILSVRWFEDALKAYGVPTMLFDLYILVPNIEIATYVLKNNEWRSIPQQHSRIGNALLDLSSRPQLRLAPPYEEDANDPPACPSLSQAPMLQTLPLFPPRGYEPPTVVLLPAKGWNFDLEKNTYSAAFVPPLGKLLDGLIDSLLDCSEQETDLQDHLDVQLAYLYGHVPELQESAFAEVLLYEHRQYHLDILSGMNYGTLPFIAHQRKIRKALREGDCALQRCSSTRDNEDLFHHEVQARLLASMPSL